MTEITAKFVRDLAYDYGFDATEGFDENAPLEYDAFSQEWYDGYNDGLADAQEENRSALLDAEWQRQHEWQD